LFKDNLDVAVINVGHEDLSAYRLIVVPGLYLLDRSSAAALNRYVAAGGTLVMTAYSAKVNEHNQWYDTPLPGGLDEVFGLRTSEFYNASSLVMKIGADEVQGEIGFYEVLEPSSAKVIASFSNLEGTPPAITEHRFGKGRAIYVATPAQPAIMQALYRRLYTDLDLARGPSTPEGVYARVVDGRTLYVNTTAEIRNVALNRTGRGLISGKSATGTLQLAPWGVELIDKQ
jgi:beta-galactosidase